MSAVYRVEKNVPVRMRDGVATYADVYRPDDGKRHPALLVRTPYNKEVTTLAQAYIDAMRAVGRGYAVVIQDVRGRFSSEGTFNPFHQEIDDGFDSVEWCGTQEWSSGAVGMYGGSYVGAVQWLAAMAQPPHLKCIVPMLTSSDYHEGWTYQSGALQWGFLATWVPLMLASEGLYRNRAKVPDFDRRRAELVALIDGLDKAFETVPLLDLPLVKEFAPYYSEWLAHQARDAYWKAITNEGRYADVRVPALNVGGWYDIFQAGTLRNFAGIRADGGTPEARDGSRLLMGGWNHWVPTTNVVGSVDFGIASASNLSPLGFDYDEEILRFFDYWLQGVDNGLASEPAVKMFVTGVDEWRQTGEWPPAGASPTSWYLRSGGRANSSGGDGTLSTEMPAGDPADHFVYDPRNPVPTRGGQLCCYPPAQPYGAFDQRDVELRDDVLVFRSEPLERDLEVVGTVSVALWATTDAPDTDFTAKLVDGEPCGFARNLVDGIVRLRFSQGIDKERPVPAGEVRRHTIELGAVGHVFRKGHRIVLEVSSSNHPRFDRNPNTGRSLITETETRTANQTVHHDQTRPSHLVLPVVHGSPAATANPKRTFRRRGSP